MTGSYDAARSPGRAHHIKGLRLEPGEHTLVATRPHPVHLLVPAAVAWCTVLVYSAARRLLDLSWNPVSAPWTTLHSFIGLLLTVAAVWITVAYALLPAWRWWRTHFVITDHRLALVGPHARGGAVGLPLTALRATRVAAPGGVHSVVNHWVDRATVIADFGRLGGLKLVGCPRPGTVVRLLREPQLRHAAREGLPGTPEEVTAMWQDHYSGAGTPPQHGDEQRGGRRG